MGGYEEWQPVPRWVFWRRWFGQTWFRRSYDWHDSTLIYATDEQVARQYLEVTFGQG